MTTSTLDLIDWATCLDDAPGCERCDSVATHRIFWQCRCRPWLSCWPCAENELENIADGVACGQCFKCAICGVVTVTDRVSGILTVAPL